MPNFRSLKPREIDKILRSHNFYLKRQTGSHRIYNNAQTNAIVVVPFHSRSIPKGTLRSIVKQSKLTTAEFFK